MIDLIQNGDLENAKIDMACENFKKVRRSNNDKFLKLDMWLKKESKIFLNETLHKSVRYMKYKQGTIVKVDFGINIGTELSNLHFAIVMDKDDNVYKGTVCVVPLTSKGGKHKLKLGNFLSNEFYKKVKIEIGKISDDNELKMTLEEIEKLKQEYKKYEKVSYANVSQMKCISKNRIEFSKSKVDITGKARVSDKVLTKIKKEISKKLL